MKLSEKEDDAPAIYSLSYWTYKKEKKRKKKGSLHVWFMKILWKEWIAMLSILAQNILPRERYTTSLVFKIFMPTVIWSYRNFSTMVMKIMLEEYYIIRNGQGSK